VTFLSIGDAKYDVLRYLKAHPNIQIPEMPTEKSQKEREGTQLKARVKLEENGLNHCLLDF